MQRVLFTYFRFADMLWDIIFLFFGGVTISSEWIQTVQFPFNRFLGKSARFRL